MAAAILQKLEDDCLNVQNCRGQAYDKENSDVRRGAEGMGQGVGGITTLSAPGITKVLHATAAVVRSLVKSYNGMRSALWRAII